MGSRNVFPIVLLAVLGVSAAQGETLYKWIDKDGHVSYHDQPPADASYRVEEKNLGGNKKKEDDTLANVVEKYPVVLYTVPACDSCDLVRAYLQKRMVPFTEQNLDNNPELQQALKKKIGSLSAPTIMIGEKVMKGYVESLLAGELDAVGYPRMPAPEAATGDKQGTDNNSTSR